MYNGIGLATARGSGTSGHVQRNMSFVRAQVARRRRDETAAAGRQEHARREALKPKAPNPAILMHSRKRAVEVELMDFRAHLVH